MKLEETLYDYTNDTLKELIQLTGDGAPSLKDDLVAHLMDLLTTPESLREKVWDPMQDLAKKAVSSAYHNDGLFYPNAFAAQYGSLPERPRKNRWTWYAEPILMDLVIHDGEIPSELMPLLEELVLPPDRFEITGEEEAPSTLEIQDEEVSLIRIDTEKTGLSDLLAYLHMVDEGDISLTSAGRRITASSARKVLPNLTDGDFFDLDDKPRAAETHRPYALDVFTQESGLVSSSTSPYLTEEGRALWQERKPEALLDAFETWTHEGEFDEMSRISELSGQEASKTRLTPPAQRRAQIIEALSWCPAGVWIGIEEFRRAMLIWHFDFEVEETDYTNLSLGSSPDSYWVGDEYWRIVNGLYVHTVLWEYLATIGALDVIYAPPDEVALTVESYGYYERSVSPYDSLLHFRINDLGAYLLGQEADYEPLRPSEEALFAIDEDRTLTLRRDPEALTPHLRMQLDRVTEEQDDGQYRLTSERLLKALEDNRNWDELVEFLTRHHDGELPEAVTDWLEHLRENSKLFSRGSNALFITVQRKKLIDEVLADDVLGSFTHHRSGRTLVIPSSRETTFRKRLRELEYVLL